MKKKENVMKMDKEIPGYTSDEIKKFLTKEEQEEFSEFMFGQTIGINSKDQKVIYEWDFEKFAMKVESVRKRYFENVE